MNNGSDQAVCVHADTVLDCMYMSNDSIFSWHGLNVLVAIKLICQQVDCEY